MKTKLDPDSKIKLDPDSKIKLDPDMKCAPSKKYTNGSCFTHKALKQIATKYNNRQGVRNKININGSKDELVNELETRLADKCSDQTCWLRLDFVKAIDDEEIHDDTFKPIGPRGKYEWLSTNHINDVIDQYHSIHNDFLFLGTVPSDFEELPILGISNIKFEDLEKDGKTKLGLVVNLDRHDQDGSHWVSVYSDLQKNQIYFFDSVGKPPIKGIKKFINRLVKYLYKKKYNTRLPINDIVSGKNKKYLQTLIGGGFDIRYNNIQHQFANSECGVYSINFITRLINGETFDNIITNPTSDEDMNKFRKEYFRNVN